MIFFCNILWCRACEIVIEESITNFDVFAILSAKWTILIAYQNTRTLTSYKDPDMSFQTEHYKISAINKFSASRWCVLMPSEVSPSTL